MENMPGGKGLSQPGENLEEYRSPSIPFRLLVDVVGEHPSRRCCPALLRRERSTGSSSQGSCSEGMEVGNRTDSKPGEGRWNQAKTAELRASRMSFFGLPPETTEDSGRSSGDQDVIDGQDRFAAVSSDHPVGQGLLDGLLGAGLPDASTSSSWSCSTSSGRMPQASESTIGRNRVLEVIAEGRDVSIRATTATASPEAIMDSTCDRGSGSRRR